MIHPQTALIVLSGALLVAASGCQTTPHQRARAEATQQWNVARSRVKAQLARERFNAGDVETAASELAEARRLNPDARELDPLHVRVLLSQGKFAEAARHLEAARARGESAASGPRQPAAGAAAPAASPELPGGLPRGDRDGRAELAYLTGLVRQEQGRWSEARLAFAEACELAPEEESYQIELARTHLQCGEAQRALDVLLQAGQGAGSRDYYAALAECWEALGNAPEAALAWQQAAAGAAPGRQLRSRLGAALQRAGRPADAAAVLEELLREPPPDGADAAGDRIALARCYLALGRAGEAAAQARAVLQEDAQHGAATVLLAQALGMQGESAAALRVAQQGLDRAPESRVLLELQAALHWSRQEPEAALQAAERLKAVAPGNEVAEAILRRAVGRASE